MFISNVSINMQLSLGDLLAFADRTVLNPWISAFAPACLHYFTSNRFVVLHKDGLLPYRIQTPLPPLLYKSLVLLAVGVALRINRSLSRRALNDGVNAKFDWNKEIIVVTGASGGIGAEAAQKLAARGSKVVVLDVIPLSYSKRKFHTPFHVLVAKLIQPPTSSTTSATLRTTIPFSRPLQQLQSTYPRSVPLITA